MAKLIPLTKGKAALVDESDFEYLNQFSWYVKEAPHTDYAVRMVTVDGTRRQVEMGAFLLNISPLVVDHRNHEGLDNTRQNLRPATRSDNSRNRRSAKNSSSQYLGVSWCNSRKCWEVRIRVKKSKKYLGRFPDELSAAKAYDKAAKAYFGEFASLNFGDN